MASIKLRGNTYVVIYSIKGSNGKHKNYWESYKTELEAINRKHYIDVLQQRKLIDGLRRAAEEYKNRLKSQAQTHYDATFQEFKERWLPFYTRKQQLSPATYDSMVCILETHILPYFGNRIVSTILSEDLDDFLDHLSNKKCVGAKSYN